MRYQPKNYIACEVCNSKHHITDVCDTCEKRERLSRIKCPCCKSDKIEEGGVYSSNGVMGSGYHSTNKFPHLFCLECGVIFKNLKSKNNG